MAASLIVACMQKTFPSIQLYIGAYLLWLQNTRLRRFLQVLIFLIFQAVRHLGLPLMSDPMKKVDCQSSELALSRVPYSCLSTTVLNPKKQGARHRKPPSTSILSPACHSLLKTLHSPHSRSTCLNIPPKKTGGQTQKTAICVHPVSGMSQSSQNVALSSSPKHLSQHSTKKDQGATHRKTLVFLRLAAWSGPVLYCQNQRFFFRSAPESFGHWSSYLNFTKISPSSAVITA